MRNQIDGRAQLTDSERKELAEIGAKLGKKALAEIVTKLSLRVKATMSLQLTIQNTMRRHGKKR